MFFYCEVSEGLDSVLTWFLGIVKPYVFICYWFLVLSWVFLVVHFLIFFFIWNNVVLYKFVREEPDYFLSVSGCGSSLLLISTKRIIYFLVLQTIDDTIIQLSWSYLCSKIAQRWTFLFKILLILESSFETSQSFFIFIIYWTFFLPY